MNRKFLYTAWAVLFILCAAFGFVPERSGVLQALLTVLSLVFFLPPAMLLYKAAGKTRKTVGLLSAVSLGATLVMLVLNIVLATGSTALEISSTAFSQWCPPQCSAAGPGHCPCFCGPAC